MHYLTYVLVPEKLIEKESDDFEYKASKFCCQELVPEGTEHVGAHVLDLLHLYYMDLEVKPYPDVCDCITDAAFTKAVQLAGEKFGPSPNIAPWLRGAASKPEDDYPYQAHHDFMMERYDELLPTTQADPDCDQCSGTGTRMITSNPNGKWDWWSVGEGFTAGILRSAITDSSVDLVHEDMIPCTHLDLRRIQVPYAIVTPDGKWHEAESPEDRQWEETARKLLEQHQDCVVVAVNCHR